MTQSTIFNISLDIVQLGLLLSSVDPETHVLCELYNNDVVFLLKKFVFIKKNIITDLKMILSLVDSEGLSRAF